MELGGAGDGALDSTLRLRSNRPKNLAVKAPAASGSPFADSVQNVCTLVMLRTMMDFSAGGASLKTLDFQHDTDSEQLHPTHLVEEQANPRERHCCIVLEETQIAA